MSTSSIENVAPVQEGLGDLKRTEHLDPTAPVVFAPPLVSRPELVVPVVFAVVEVVGRGHKIRSVPLSDSRRPQRAYAGTERLAHDAQGILEPGQSRGILDVACFRGDNGKDFLRPVAVPAAGGGPCVGPPVTGRLDSLTTSA
eukprot:jgi/Mesvir1/7511/Mv19267-RA.1